MCMQIIKMSAKSIARLEQVNKRCVKNHLLGRFPQVSSVVIIVYFVLTLNPFLQTQQYLHAFALYHEKRHYPAALASVRPCSFSAAPPRQETSR